ncbi:hypothetical protein [Streptomonospora litoralis]|uniref:hypothetical protein n=1 Tax=Streptomonospora litoralis TaxID=2498135 RepID=UPI0010363CBF|nr:hypothetical protein [Streptomonospora litoralis]
MLLLLSWFVRWRPVAPPAPYAGRRRAGRHRAERPSRVRPYVLRAAPAPAVSAASVVTADPGPVASVALADPLPAGDGLDDVRDALRGPVRRLLAARPDLARTPGDLLAGVGR